jgi:hypothetical protein
LGCSDVMYSSAVHAFSNHAGASAFVVITNYNGMLISYLSRSEVWVFRTLSLAIRASGCNNWAKIGYRSCRGLKCSLTLSYFTLCFRSGRGPGLLVLL